RRPERRARSGDRDRLRTRGRGRRIVISIRRIVGVILGTGAGLALASLSAIPVMVNGNAGEAMIRVAFSARPQRIETCREVSDEELAEIPVHMRQTTVCEGITATYLLEVLHR